MKPDEGLKKMEKWRVALASKLMSDLKENWRKENKTVREAEKFIFKRLFAAWEGFLDAIPFVNRVYGSIKEVAQAFFGDKTGIFKRVVYVEYPRKGVYALGFVTQEKPWEIHEKTGKEIVNIFLPHPPNPATGYFIFAPKEEVMESNLTVEEGIRMVISAGAAVPGNYQKK